MPVCKNNVIPEITYLNHAKLIQSAQLLSAKGELAIYDNIIVYVRVSDEYVHELFPLLEAKNITKPDYFIEKPIGAHIMVIYPEEYIKIDAKDLGVEHCFRIKDFVAAKIYKKTYYAILLESASLLQIRKKYGLPELLSFKGHRIGFHITIGVKIYSLELKFMSIKLIARLTGYIFQKLEVA